MIRYYRITSLSGRIRCKLNESHPSRAVLLRELSDDAPVLDIQIRNSLMSSNPASSPDTLKPTNRTSLLSALSDRSGALTWYSCGPTVYDAAHLGHARTYVCTDIIRRLLVRLCNVQINFALGITDVDDKIVQKCVSLGRSSLDGLKSVVQPLELDFFEDMDRLNVQRPNAVLRVTEHMSEIIAYIQRLQNSGFAYEVVGDGIYFDVAKIGNHYGKLGAIPDIATDSFLSEGEIVSSDSLPEQRNIKRSPRDFALWKLTKSDELRQLTPANPLSSDAADSTGSNIAWPSPWGDGRPGWHIECSAMTYTYFGSKVDIHSGGIDLKFPHHTNEIAQW